MTNAEMTNKIINILKQTYPHDEGTNQHNPFDYIFEFGRPIEFILYSCIFFPSFTLIDGSILLNRYDTSLCNKFSSALAGGKERADAERALNFVDISFLFNPARDEHQELGIDKIIRDTLHHLWRHILVSSFKDRNFKFIMYGDNQDDDCYGLTFFEER